MINSILQHACRLGEPSEPFVSLTYGHRTINKRECWSFIPPKGFDWDTLPASGGIYFVLSHNRTRLQKIGIANQEDGFRNRIRGGYWGCTHDPEVQDGDASAAFWYRVMTGNNRDGELSIADAGQQVEIYFKSYSGQLRVPDVFGVGEELLSYDPHDHLERLLVKQAKRLRKRQSDQELFATDEAYPLLLDSKHRIRQKQLMNPINLLRAHRQAIPAWLADCAENTPLNSELFDAMLQSRVVFYPGSDCRDGLAFESFTHTHAAHCVIHADVTTDLDAVIKAVTGIPGSVPSIRGYRPTVLQRLTQEEARQILQLDEQRVPGLHDPNPMAQEPALDGAFWSILERNPDRGDDHGPARLAFLHVKCEAAWLFWNLWLRRTSPPPPPFAIIVSPEYGGSIERLFGTNGAAYRLEGGSARLPDWILYDRPVNELQPKLEAEWPEYEVAASDQGLRPTTFLRRRPDDHPLVVAARLRSTDFDAYWRHCLEHGLQPDHL